MTGQDMVPVASQVQASVREFALVLPPQLTPEMFTRLSIGLLRQNQSLARAADSNPIGFLQALMEAARLGLEPGTKEVALTPFRNSKTGRSDIVCIPQWQGIVKRMLNTGKVRSVHAECVFSNDVFRFDPGQERPHHEVDWFGDRGDLLGAYAYAVLDDGATSKVAVIGPREAARAKAMSKGSAKPDSAWNTDTAEMWRKTAVRRLEDWVPSSSVDQSFVLRQAAAAHQAPAPTPVGGAVVTVPAGPSIAEQAAAQAAVTAGPVEVDTSGMTVNKQQPPATGETPGTATTSVTADSDTMPLGEHGEHVNIATGEVVEAELLDPGEES
jgi:recombination protein RecT